MKTHSSTSYFGQSGQFAVMSELLSLHLNVAIPEVDVGDDILVIRDKDGTWYRVQVKSANAKERKNNYSAQFKLRLDQLSNPTTPELFYILVIRKEQKWADFIIIKRSDLNSLKQINNIGSVSGKHLILYFSIKNSKVYCGKNDLTNYKDNWSIFPPVVS
jgi:hypothetical protein